MKKTVLMGAYIPIVLMLGLLFSSSISSGLISETASLNIRSTYLEVLLVSTNTIFHEAVAQNGEEEEQSTETEEPDQDQPPPPPDCEKTTAGCPQPEDEVEGTVPLTAGKAGEIEGTVAPPAEPATTGEPSGTQLPTADTDGEPSTTMDVVPPPGGTVLPYTCSTTAYDKPTCNCVGIDDCNKLRKSGECKTGTVPTGAGEVGRCPWGGK